MGGDPASARGFYYLIGLAFIGLLWKKRFPLETWLQSRTLHGFFLFVGLGLMMIIIEETIAGITVHLLSVKSLSELPALITQYYTNNLLLLPGFIIAWYVLLKRYEYSRTEVFTLVGLFGLFSEQIYIHILTIPIMGMALLLPTMFTYIGIILPSFFRCQHMIPADRRVCSAILQDWSFPSLCRCPSFSFMLYSQMQDGLTQQF